MVDACALKGGASSRFTLYSEAYAPAFGRAGALFGYAKRKKFDVAPYPESKRLHGRGAFTRPPSGGQARCLASPNGIDLMFRFTLHPSARPQAGCIRVAPPIKYKAAGGRDVWLRQTGIVPNASLYLET